MGQAHPTEQDRLNFSIQRSVEEQNIEHGCMLLGARRVQRHEGRDGPVRQSPECFILDGLRQDGEPRAADMPGQEVARRSGRVSSSGDHGINGVWG